MEPLKVLIVDDEIDLATLTKMRLSREAPHFYITVLKSGRDCLNYLQDNHVDCILSDYQMPEMNGMQLLKSLRGKHNEMPFIFVTGQGNEAVAREAFKNGADDYFTKDIQEFAYYAKIKSPYGNGNYDTGQDPISASCMKNFAVILTDGDRRWTLTLGELGIRVDVAAGKSVLGARNDDRLHH